MAISMFSSIFCVQFSLDWAETTVYAILDDTVRAGPIPHPRRWLPYYRRPAQIVFSGSVIGLIACSRTLTVTPTTTEYEPGLRSASESQEGADFGADNSVQLFEAFGGLANEEAAEVDAPSAPLGDFQAQSAGNARD
ncbi:hypothetical protein CPB83DRAFT_899364 [Crepidotus variabilis]|uniref:Uncharacterized protein n=1 Tax=Crepidotus variabilis TaxID=179855 RepID=A0A9P6E579_9AGAR|nr:hypothetical protein CPB83DRAFT_899364 [Crepidotus variabilis]